MNEDKTYKIFNDVSQLTLMKNVQDKTGNGKLIEN